MSMNYSCIEKFIEDKKESGYRMSLLNRTNALELVELLHNLNVAIFGFDGFVKLDRNNFRIEQDYPRDYSKFNNENAYLLVKEYFLKSNQDDVLYDISFDRGIRGLK